MSVEFKRVIELVNSIPHLRAKAQECAIQEMINDECEEIGSSDINCVIVGQLSSCQTQSDAIHAVKDWCNEVLA